MLKLPSLAESHHSALLATSKRASHKSRAKPSSALVLRAGYDLINL
jgi:hypothetical protein